MIFCVRLQLAEAALRFASRLGLTCQRGNTCCGTQRGANLDFFSIRRQDLSPLSSGRGSHFPRARSSFNSFGAGFDIHTHVQKKETHEKCTAFYFSAPCSERIRNDEWYGALMIFIVGRRVLKQGAPNANCREMKTDLRQTPAAFTRSLRLD